MGVRGQSCTTAPRPQPPRARAEPPLDDIGLAHTEQRRERGVELTPRLGHGAPAFKDVVETVGCQPQLRGNPLLPQAALPDQRPRSPVDDFQSHVIETTALLRDGQQSS